MGPGSRWEGRGSQSWRTISKRTVRSLSLKPCVHTLTGWASSGPKPSFDCACDEQNVCRLISRRHLMVFEHRCGADARPVVGVPFLFQDLSSGSRTFLESGRRTVRRLHSVHLYILRVYCIAVARIEGECALATSFGSTDGM